MLAGLIEQQKALIAKLEKGKGVIKTEEKSKIMKLLKELSSYIDRTKEDIKTSLSVGGLKNRSVAEVIIDDLAAIVSEGLAISDSEGAA